MRETNQIILWIGEQDSPLKENRTEDDVTDSAYNYYKKKEPKLLYRPRRLLLDSGAFTSAMRGIQLSRDKVAYIQERLNPDLAIPLDYPFKPGMSLQEMRIAWEKTKENMLYWQYNTSLSGRVMPTLHSWNDNSLRQNLRWIEKHIDSDYIALGVIVDEDFTRFQGFFKDRQPSPSIIRSIYRAISIIKKESDFKVHIMGLGSSPLMLHIAYFMGTDSTDSSGCRRKAAYGKIILPGTGERYVCNIAGKFSRRKLTYFEQELLNTCQCEICKNDPQLLYVNWKARAIHNEYVIKKEVEKAKALLNEGRDKYEKILDDMFSKSKYGLQYIWRLVKLLTKYEPIIVR
ncbi:MAG: hypothetical protein LM601_08900 [Candidatus Verstraetearchaeota archaeon]|jgi:queuine/archaeosine tRNA-ribosyltransferase|nr:hypothetical protein [Candidatus Verstraetearchaeota archaeon]